MCVESFILVSKTTHKAPYMPLYYIENKHKMIMKIAPHYSHSTVVCEVCSKKIHRLLGKRNAYMCRGMSH